MPLRSAVRAAATSGGATVTQTSSVRSSQPASNSSAASRTAIRAPLTRSASSFSRIRAQMSNEERAARSQVVIDTDCPLEQTRKRVDEEWERLLERLETPSARSGV